MTACVMSVADVWLPSNPDGPQPAFPAATSEAVRKARESALATLDGCKALSARAADRLKTLFPKWTIESTASADSPGWGILTIATNWKADLIVLGSQGRSTLERLFLGSVSQKVAAEAGCSVRIARPRKSPHHSRLRMVVAVDGSPDSIKAVRAAADRVWPAFCEFRIVTILDSRLETGIILPEVYGALWAQEHDVAARDAICRMVEHSAKVLFDAGLTVETHLLDGDPKHELLNHAESWEADCIFIGARGQQHGKSLALGTMASAVAGRAHCSVEIVRAD
jgi:nucleotide-binding universal stress UspA family protein